MREKAIAKQREGRKFEMLANELTIELSRLGPPIAMKVCFCMPRFVGDTQGVWVERTVTDSITIQRLQQDMPGAYNV